MTTRDFKEVVIPIILVAIFAIGLVLMGVGIIEMRHDSQDDAQGEKWIDIGVGAKIKVVEIEGHRYLVTVRDGVCSHYVQTIHAESCPCRFVKGE